MLFRNYDRRQRKKVCKTIVIRVVYRTHFNSALSPQIACQHLQRSVSELNGSQILSVT